jgi:hypothetical protein
MVNKKFLILTLMSIFLISMFAGAVKAASLVDIIKDSATLKYLAVDFIAGLKQAPPDAGAVVVAKVLFGILIIIVINSLLAITPTVSEWNKNARVSMAVVISLIAVFAIPNIYLVNIIVGAGYVLILIPMILLSVLCYYGMFKWFPGTERTDYIWKTVFAGFAAYLLASIAALLDGVGGDLGFGVIGLVSSILNIAVVINWFYLIYAVYSAITGPAGAKGAGAKLAEKVPKLGRQLRRLGRAAYRAERVTDRETEELENDIANLGAVNLSVVDVGAGGASAMREVKNHLQPIRRRLNEKTIERIKDRTNNLAVDMYSWAKQIKDKKMISEAEGIEVLVEKMGTELDVGEKLFKDVWRVVETRDNLDMGFTSDATKDKAIKNLKDAVNAYQKAHDILKNQIKKLEEDIMTKAGTTELHP